MGGDAVHLLTESGDLLLHQRQCWVALRAPRRLPTQQHDEGSDKGDGEQEQEGEKERVVRHGGLL